MAAIGCTSVSFNGVRLATSKRSNNRAALRAANPAADARRPLRVAATSTKDAAAMLKDGVSIRRRPPGGIGKHAVGSDFDFKVPDIDNEPNNILEEIVWYKNIELDHRKEHLPLNMVMSMVKAAAPARDFIGALKEASAKTGGKPGLIAEVKKASPSKGVIQPNFDPVRIAQEYEKGGAACLSVLTDEKFFQGAFENLKEIRRNGVRAEGLSHSGGAAARQCPLLCKEFVIEPYQIFLGRAMGADAVLLIAAVLPNQDLKYLMKIAKSVGMTVLLEVHTEAEMERVLELEGLELLGINNRNLETFEVTLDVTKDLMAGPLGDKVRERGIMVVGESGIFTYDDVKTVQDAGVSAILVGESLVRENDPCTAIKKLLDL